METPSPPYPLSTRLYHHQVHCLTDLLPPKLDDRSEARHDSNHAAIAKVAAGLLPLLRQHAGDIG